MSARQLPQPSPEATRRRLASLLDATPGEPWEDVDDIEGIDGPAERGPDPGREPVSRTIVGTTPWRRETVLVLCAVVLVGVVVAGLVLLRSSPLEIAGDAAVTTPAVVGGTPIGPASPSAPASPSGQASPGASASPGAPAGTPAPGAASGTPAPSTLAVHVVGPVQRPGLVTLAPGARVDDAIIAAGGLTSKADTGDLNLAQPLLDGQQVVIGSTSKPGGQVRGPDGTPAGGGAATGGASATPGTGGPRPGPASGPAAAGGTINLNTASALELEELPGVGPATAQKIITWREQNGGFATVEQLMDVPGIGPKTYAEIAPRAGI